MTATGFRTGPFLDDMRPKIARARALGPRVFSHDAVGMVGLYTGPDRHIVDVLGLCDPLLARLPATRPWRIGHYNRDAPAGYLESLAEDRNLIEDPALRSHIR
jgi:arabinofuranosyltransferase